MHVSLHLAGLVFQRVEAATTVIGTTKGGWVYASQRPCYEAKTPPFFAMEHPLSRSDVAGAMGKDGEAEDTTPMEELTSYDLAELAATVMERADFTDTTAELEGSWEVRALTHAEWLAARDQGVVSLDRGLPARGGWPPHDALAG